MQLSVHAVCYLLRCVVEYIATDLCFKTSYTLVKACGRNSTTIFTALYIKMVHISKCINIRSAILTYHVASYVCAKIIHCHFVMLF